jgi:hypothetical protein
VVTPGETPRVVPDDPDDDRLAAAARAAGAALVTNDARLPALAGHEGLKVVRPADLQRPACEDASRISRSSGSRPGARRRPSSDSRSTAATSTSPRSRWPASPGS